METRDEPLPDKTAVTAPGAGQHRQPDAALQGQAGAGEWQAMLLRYLPDPRGSQHSVKRFAAR